MLAARAHAAVRERPRSRRDAPTRRRAEPAAAHAAPPRRASRARAKLAADPRAIRRRRASRPRCSAPSASAGPEITERTIDDPSPRCASASRSATTPARSRWPSSCSPRTRTTPRPRSAPRTAASVLETCTRRGSARSIACPMVLVPRTQLRWLSIDHRAGFVLSLIDGSSTLEMILDVCGMPRSTRCASSTSSCSRRSSRCKLSAGAARCPRTPRRRAARYRRIEASASQR